jgi:NADPH:quinone reductase
MKAILCKEWGGPEKLVFEDVASPPLRDGAVKIKVYAAGVNFMDTLLIAGQYQVKPPLPFTPGGEISGIVTEVGSGVNGFKPGDRVMATTENGGYAEDVVVRAERVFAIPDQMDFPSAASFPVVYGTSHVGLAWRAFLKAGEWLLVTGAAGGVGLTAVEVGKAMGAQVIAAAGGQEKLAVAQQHGADHLIDYSREDLRERVKAITLGRGAGVIYDPVGGDVFDACLRCIAWEGRILIIGFAAGRIPQIPANIALVKNIDVIGFFWGSYQTHKPEVPRESFKQLFRWFQEGKIRPHVSQRVPLQDAPRALELLKQRKATGKVVLTMRDA